MICTYLTSLTFIFPAEAVAPAAARAVAVTLRGLPTSAKPLCYQPPTPWPLLAAEPTTMPPLTEERCVCPAPMRGFTAIEPVCLPMIGYRFGLKGCFFGNVSARYRMLRICSCESIEGAFCILDCFEAVVVRVVFEPPWLIFFATDWKSSIACPTTLFIL